MLTVRLPKDLEHEIDVISKQRRITKSELVKKAILEFLKTNGKTSYESGKDLFGCDDSIILNGSKTYKQNVGRRIHEKHSH